MKPLDERMGLGLLEVWRLASADAESDMDRYPETHPIWDALAWIDAQAGKALGGGR